MGSGGAAGGAAPAAELEKPGVVKRAIVLVRHVRYDVSAKRAMMFLQNGGLVQRYGGDVVPGRL